MNSQNDNQAETTEGATVSFPELHGAEGETLAGFNAKQSARILSRLAIERAKVEGKRIQAQAWQTLAAIHAETADKLATLRERFALLDSI